MWLLSSLSPCGGHRAEDGAVCNVVSTLFLQDAQGDPRLCSSLLLTTGGSHVLPDLHDYGVIYNNQRSYRPPVAHICAHTYRQSHALRKYAPTFSPHWDSCTSSQRVLNPASPYSVFLPTPGPPQLAVSKQTWLCRDVERCRQRDGHKAYWWFILEEEKEEVWRSSFLTLQPCASPTNIWMEHVAEASPDNDKTALIIIFFISISAQMEKGHVYALRHSHK